MYCNEFTQFDDNSNLFLVKGKKKAKDDKQDVKIKEEPEYEISETVIQDIKSSTQQLYDVTVFSHSKEDKDFSSANECFMVSHKIYLNSLNFDKPLI